MARLCDWLQGLSYIVYSGTDEAEVSEVVTDSRKAAPGTFFICISGERSDGHDFIGDAVSLGCRAVMVEKEVELAADVLRDTSIIKVPDTRRALAIVSAARFGHPASRLTLVGITGTKGKTSTSYMLKRVLDEAGISTGVIGTNGSVIGGEHIPTLNTTPDSYELNRLFAGMAESGVGTCVMECSSQGFKLERTYALHFRIGMFLCLSPDHIGQGEHASFEEYLSCKLCLMRQCETAVINLDDEYAPLFMAEAQRAGAKVVTFSVLDKAADLYAHDIGFSFGADHAGSTFSVSGLAEGDIRLSIPGDYYVSNALGVIAAGVLLGAPMDAVERALATVSVDGRMETVYLSDRFMCLVDYAHNGMSMENLIRTLRCYERGRIVVVFGCGGNRSKDRRITMGESAARHADFSVITSDNSRYERPEDIIEDIAEAYIEAGGSPDAFVRIPDRREAIRYALSHAMDGDIIAVIGKGHEDYQEEGGIRRHFLDREEILRAVEELGL